MANRYWRGNISTVWGTTGNWSSTSPTYTSAAAPTANDDVIFNTDSSTNCVIDGTVAKVCRSFTVNGYTGTISNSSTAALTIGISTTDASTYTMLSLNPGVGFSLTYANLITLQGIGNYTITTNNTILNSSITITTAGTWTVDSSGGLLTGSTKTLTVNGGTLIANGSNSSGYNISAGLISSTGATTRNIRATNIEISGASATAWNSTGSNLNLKNSGNTGAPNIYLTNNTAATRYIVNSATAIPTTGSVALNNVYINGNPNGAAIGINGWTNGTIANVYTNTSAGAVTGTITYNGCTITGSLDFTGLTTATAVASNATTTLNGNLILSSLYNITGTAPIIFGGTSTVTGNGKTYPGTVTVNTSGSVTFSDSISLGSTLTLTTGTTTFTGSGTITGAIAVNGGTLNINNNFVGNSTLTTAGTAAVSANSTGSIVLSGALTHGSSGTMSLSKPISCTTITNNGAGALTSISIIKTSGLVTITNGTFNITDLNINALTVSSGATLTSATAATNISISTTNGSNNVTLNNLNTSFLTIGATISGTGFATSVTIVSITNSTTFVVSANADTTGTNTVSYSCFNYIAGTYSHVGIAGFNRIVYCNVLTLTGGTLTCNEHFNFAASSSITTGTITNTTSTPKVLASNSISTSTGAVTGTTATLTLTSGSIIFPYISVGFFIASNANSKTLTTDTVNLSGSNATAASAYVWNTTGSTIGTNFTCTVNNIYLVATPAGADYSIFYPGTNSPLSSTNIYLQGTGIKGLYACNVNNVYPSGTITIISSAPVTINGDFQCDGNAAITFNTSVAWSVGGDFLLPGGSTGGSGSATFTASPVLTLNNAGYRSVINISGYINGNYTSAITLYDPGSVCVYNFKDAFSSTSTLTLTQGRVRAEFSLAFTTVNLTAGSSDAIVLGSGSTGWTTGTGWSGNSTSGFIHTPGNTATLTNSVLPSLGAVYTVDYTITNCTAGSVSISFGGNTILGLNSSFFKCIISSSNTANLIITPTSDFDGTILVTMQEVSFAVKSDLNATTTTFNNDSIYVFGSLYCTTLTANNTRLYIEAGSLNLAGTTTLNLLLYAYVKYGLYNSTNTSITITTPAYAIYYFPYSGVSYGVSTSGTTLSVTGFATLRTGGGITAYTITTSGGYSNIIIDSGGSIAPSITTGNGIIIGGNSFIMNQGSYLSISVGVSISSGTNFFNGDAIDYTTTIKSLTVTGGITTFRKYTVLDVRGNITITNGVVNAGTIQNNGYGTITLNAGATLNSYQNGVYLGNGIVGSISTISGGWTAVLSGLSTTIGIEPGQVIIQNTISGTGSLYGGSPTYYEVVSVLSCTSLLYKVIGGTTPIAGTVTNVKCSFYGSDCGVYTNSLTCATNTDSILYIEGKLYLQTGGLTFIGSSLTIKNLLHLATSQAIGIAVVNTADIYYGIISDVSTVGAITINNAGGATGSHSGSVSIGSTAVPLSNMTPVYSTGNITFYWGYLNLNCDFSISRFDSDTTAANSTSYKYFNIRSGTTLTIRASDGTQYNSNGYFTYAFNMNNPRINQLISGGNYDGSGVGLTNINFKGAIIKFTNSGLVTSNQPTTYMDYAALTGQNGGTIWFNRQTNNPSYNGTTNAYTTSAVTRITATAQIKLEGIWDGEPDWNNKQSYEIVSHTLDLRTYGSTWDIVNFNVNGYQSSYTYPVSPGPTTITIDCGNFATVGANSFLNKVNPQISTGVYETYTSGYLEIGKYYKINSVNSCDDFSNVGYTSPGVPFLVTGSTVASTTFGLTTINYTAPNIWKNNTNVIKLNTLVVGKTYKIDTLVSGDNFLNVGYIAPGVPFIATGVVPTNWTTTVIYELGTEINVNNLNVKYSTVTPGIDSSGADSDIWHAYNSTDNNNGTVTTLGWDFVQYRYWVGAGANQNWNNIANWSSTSGGAGGFSVPSSKINVIFDANSFYCTLNVNGSCKTLQSLNWGYGFTTATTNTLTIYGDTEIGNSFMQNAQIGAITINSAGKNSTLTFGSIISSGTIPLQNNIVLTGVNGQIKFMSNLVQASANTLEHRAGVLDFNGYNITTRSFFNTQTNIDATIYLRNGTFTLGQYSNNGYAWNISNGYCSVNSGTSTIVINDTGTGQILFRGSLPGSAYGIINIYNLIYWNRGSSTATCVMQGGGFINNFIDGGTESHTLNFEQNSATNVYWYFNNFNVNGAAGKLITLTGSSTAYISVFYYTGGVGPVICNNVKVQYNYADNATPAYSGLPTWFTSPSNLGTNAIGWNLSNVPSIAKKMLLLGVGGSN